MALKCASSCRGGFGRAWGGGAQSLRFTRWRFLRETPGNQRDGCCWEFSPVPQGWVMECAVTCHVPLCMWKIHLNQTGGLQGFHHVSGDVLAADDLGTGSGWQQSKQNQAPPAVMRRWIRMQGWTTSDKIKARHSTHCFSLCARRPCEAGSASHGELGMGAALFGTLPKEV